MKAENMETLLCAFLDCGRLNLSILDDVNYNLGTIIVRLQNEGIKPTLNAITDSIFCEAVVELAERLGEKIIKLESECDEYDEDSNEYKELQEQIDELECCNLENDVDWFCNYLDTSIWFSNNEEIYRKYLKNEIAEVENHMGFEFIQQKGERFYYESC